MDMERQNNGGSRKRVLLICAAIALIVAITAAIIVPRQLQRQAEAQARAQRRQLARDLCGVWTRAEKDYRLRLTVYATGEETVHMEYDFISPLIGTHYISSFDYEMLDGATIHETQYSPNVGVHTVTMEQGFFRVTPALTSVDESEIWHQ